MHPRQQDRRRSLTLNFCVGQPRIQYLVLVVDSEITRVLEGEQYDGTHIRPGRRHRPWL